MTSATLPAENHAAREIEYMNSNLPRQKILIVDDMPTNIKVLGDALKREYTVLFATSGDKALTIAFSPHPPDLILLDIMMPDMDGYEVCRRLKSDKQTWDIPGIFISSKSEEEHETLGLEFGAVDYIRKPFSLPIARARVKTHLELKRHRDFLGWMRMKRTSEIREMEAEYARSFLRDNNQN